MPNLPYRAARYLMSAAHTILAVFEPLAAKYAPNNELANHPPVFIIGAPRSGTTLLYQVLVNRYKFAYFSNFSNHFFRAPIIASSIANWTFANVEPPAMYRSKHGVTDMSLGPHEAGQFWYRWFPKGEHIYVETGATPQDYLCEMRSEVSGVSRVVGASLLFKNTYNSMRVAPLLEAFPEACFLVCYRDPVDTAQSILKGRIERFDSKEEWWSLPPKEIDELKTRPYWEQIVDQIFYTYKQIEHDKQRFGADKFHDVHYEDICNDTYSVLSNIEHFFVEHGISVQIRSEVPNKFLASTGRSISEEDYARIQRRVNERWP